jgi:3-phenylpropionate/trans-cinnamate dioxygenase ferredoxin reductase subunit
MVVVGGGVGGASAVAELRRAGFDGAITLICAEDTPPYERPPLSKGFLLGAEADGGAIPDPDWYAGQDIELLLGARATDLDLANRSVGLAGGLAVEYDGLLLATGVRPRVLPGVDGEGVCYLRTVGDAADLRERMRAAEHVAVLGGGFIGCEVAAAAVQLGKQVTILEALPALLQRAVGAELGELIAGIHRGHGVDVRTGQLVTGVRRQGRGLSVTTGDGTIGCDVLVVGAGTVPNQELAERAGLPAGNGILTDEYCATTAPGVYAIGDVAAQHLPGYGRRVRVEHHDTAIRQGVIAARNLLGRREAFTDVHWFWSDQYEHTIQSAGLAGDPQDFGPRHGVLRGSLEQHSFSAFSLDGERIRAVLALNRPRDVLDTRRLLAREHRITAAQLRDESTPLKRLAQPERAATAT